ncbi:MAG: NTP transferase domain-containing protein [Methanomicrobiales archaeon]|nr:NTP transferase domain-containing protein [Methanomicrobiales archaeon]MDD1647228.1 NTP transferase domain-containing protein [Methanomicrobiales archaeon]
MQAVILAAGEGMRLRPLTHSRPKAMIPVANRPIIAHVMDALIENGIRDLVVVAGYRKESVLSYCNRLPFPVTTVVQKRQLGTADALRAAAGEIHDDFLVVPGDNFIDAASIAKVKDVQNAMLVREHESPSNFGVVVIRKGYVTGIIEKPELAPTVTVSTGIFSLTPGFLDRMEATELPDAVMDAISGGMMMKAIHAEGWQDAIYPWDVLKLNRSLLARVEPQKGGRIHGSVIFSGTVRVGEGTTLGPHTTLQGPVVIGDDCQIGPGCCIMPHTSIGSRVRIEPFTLVSGSLLMDDVSVGSHSHLQDAVVGEGCSLADHTSTVRDESLFSIEGKVQKAAFGAVLGDRVTAAPFTVFRNCVVGNGVSLRSGRVITSVVPDGTLVM